MAKTVALLFLATANPVVSLSLPRAKTFSMEDRRSFTNKVFTAGAGLAGAAAFPGSSRAAAISTSGARVLVAGASGQTGSRVLSQLLGSYPALTTVAGVRTPSKVKSTAVKLDLEDPSTFAAALEGCDAVVSAVGFVPGSPFDMQKKAHAVDNVGTCALIDAAKAAGVKKFVLVSSILTDAGAWNQRGSAGFKITNAFGGVLDEKIVAEKYLRKSGLDYTIVRPGGLKSNGPSGALVVSGENTLNKGEVSRDTVALVCIQALFAPKSANRVVEIYESEADGAATPPVDQWF